MATKFRTIDTKRAAAKYEPADGYNVTVWRFLPGGQILSVAVAEYRGDRIIRSNVVTCTGLEGSALYHDYIMARECTFGGKPVGIAITRGTGGYIDAIGSFERAWNAHKDTATELVATPAAA
jgi:hypothetical protein